MVFLHVKREESVQFLIEAPAATPVGQAAATAAEMHNLVRRIHRLCEEGVRLAQHGPIECEAEAAPSPLAQLQAAREAAHMEATAAILSGKDPGNEEPAAGGSGSVAHSEGSEEAARWTEASAAAAAPSAALADVSLGDGQQEAASAAAPAGSASEARTADDGHHGGAAAAEDAQQAPPAELMLIEKGAGERLRLALLAAAELTDKERPAEKVLLTLEALQSAITAVRDATDAAFPGGLPERDPFEEELRGTRQLPTEGMHIDIPPDAAIFYFAGRLLDNAKTLAQSVGRHEKTRAVVWIVQQGDGAPPKEKMDDKEYAKMLSYYYKKQEEQKRLEEDMDLSHYNSAWADSKSLKNALTGIGAIQLRPTGPYRAM